MDESTLAAAYDRLLGPREAWGLFIAEEVSLTDGPLLSDVSPELETSLSEPRVRGYQPRR